MGATAQATVIQFADKTSRPGSASLVHERGDNGNVPLSQIASVGPVGVDMYCRSNLEEELKLWEAYGSDFTVPSTFIAAKVRDIPRVYSRIADRCARRSHLSPIDTHHV